MDQQIAEQQTQAPVVDPAVIANDEPTDAELVAAVKEAGGTESVDVAAEEAKATGTEPAETPAEEPKIAAVLRAREKAFAERQEAEDYAAQRKRSAEQEAEQILAAARKRAHDDYEAEIQQRKAKFRETPGEVIRSLGTPEEIHDLVMREGTPEWRAIRAAEARAQAAEAKAGGVDAIKADFEAFKNQVTSQQQQETIRSVERQFLTEHANTDKAPTLHRIAASIPNVPGAVRGEAAVVAWGHALAAQWRAAGVQFANSDVAEYLEHQARTGTLGVSSSPPQVSGASGAPKVRANGSRTLSASNGSERRASPKPLDEMTPDEERRALIEAVAEARRTSGS